MECLLTMKQSKNAPTITLSPFVACTFNIMKSYTVRDMNRTNPNMCDQMLIVSFVHQKTLKKKLYCIFRVKLVLLLTDQQMKMPSEIIANIYN